MNAEAEALGLYHQALEAEEHSPRQALKFYRQVDRINTKVCMDVFLVALVAPVIAALIVDRTLSVVRPFWVGVVFAVIGIFPAIYLVYIRIIEQTEKPDSRTFWAAVRMTALLVVCDFILIFQIVFSILIGMVVILLPISLGFSLFAGMPFFRVDLLPQFITRPVIYILLYLSLVMWFTNVPLYPLYGIRRLIIDGIAGLLDSWEDLFGFLARFGLIALAIAVPQFNHYELLVSSAVAGFLLAISLFRINIDKNLSRLIELGRLRAHFRLGRRWIIYNFLTTLIEDTSDDETGIKYLVYALAHQKVLYAWQICPPPDQMPGCIGGLIWDALNSGLTMLPYFKESPIDILNEARLSDIHSQSLREVWQQTIIRTEEVMNDAMRERATRNRLSRRVVKRL